MLAGETIFKGIGCAVCHTETSHTVPPGTPINGGTYTVPAAIGNREFDPYSDFLVHDIGTGDGIPVTPGTCRPPPIRCAQRRSGDCAPATG